MKIMARDNPDTGRKRKIFSSWQVPVRRDVKIVGAGGYFTTQDESYHTFLEVEFSRWTGKCCEIRLFPGIFIDPSVQTLAEFESGQTIGVTGHFPAPGEQEGIGNGPYELVYPHERGHAEVFFEWAVPRLISKLEPYCTNGKRYKTEWAKKFARASIGLDAQIILHTPVYLTESNKRADKLAAEKMYLLPSYGFVEKFPPVTGIAWDVRRYKRVWEKK